MAKKSGKKILRVGLIQNQRILEERLFRNPQTVTVGHHYKKNTLVVPASNLPKTFPVFKWDGKAYILQFTEKMEGRISRGQGVESLEELRNKGVAKKKGKLYRLRLSPTMRGRVVVGEATVLFQFVTPPPERARPVLPASMRGGLIGSGIDRPLAALMMVSAIIQVGFVVYLEIQDWPEDEDDFRLIHDDTVAEIEEDDDDEEEEEDEIEEDEGDEPEEQDPDPDPEPAPEEDEQEDDEPDDDHEEDIRETEEREDQVDMGVVGAVEDDRVGDIIDGVADETEAMAAFDGADTVEHTGDVGADVLATGDDEADGEAVGNGGMDEEIGSSDDPGGDVDGPGEEEVEVIETDMRQDEPEDLGDLDPQQMMRALDRLSHAVEGCYENQLRQDPNASGTVRVMVTVTDRRNRGVVDSAEVVVDDVGGGVGDCIASEIERATVRMPAPEDGQDARVTVPYHFSPGG